MVVLIVALPLARDAQWMGWATPRPAHLAMSACLCCGASDVCRSSYAVGLVEQEPVLWYAELFCCLLFFMDDSHVNWHGYSQVFCQCRWNSLGQRFDFVLHRKFCQHRHHSRR